MPLASRELILSLGSSTAEKFCLLSSAATSRSFSARRRRQLQEKGGTFLRPQFSPLSTTKCSERLAGRDVARGARSRAQRASALAARAAAAMSASNARARARRRDPRCSSARSPARSPARPAALFVVRHSRLHAPLSVARGCRLRRASFYSRSRERHSAIHQAPHARTDVRCNWRRFSVGLAAVRHLTAPLVHQMTFCSHWSRDAHLIASHKTCARALHQFSCCDIL